MRAPGRGGLLVHDENYYLREHKERTLMDNHPRVGGSSRIINERKHLVKFASQIFVTCIRVSDMSEYEVIANETHSDKSVSSTYTLKKIYISHNLIS